MAWYSGDADDAMAAAQNLNWRANGRIFSTADNDNDNWATGSCAAIRRCGWWFGRCSTNNVNRDTSQNYGIWTTGKPVWDVQASRMMVKLY